MKLFISKWDGTSQLVDCLSLLSLVYIGWRHLWGGREREPFKHIFPTVLLLYTTHIREREPFKHIFPTVLLLYTTHIREREPFKHIFPTVLLLYTTHIGIHHVLMHY